MSSVSANQVLMRGDKGLFVLLHIHTYSVPSVIWSRLGQAGQEDRAGQGRAGKNQTQKKRRNHKRVSQNLNRD